MFIEQIVEFEMRGHGLLAVQILLQAIIFMAKQKPLTKALSRVFYYLLLKYCREQCTFLLPTWVKSLAKFNPKFKILNMFWG